MTNRLRMAAGAALLTLALVGSIQLRAVDGEPAGMTLRELIQTAYTSPHLGASRHIVGGPGWMEIERFAIAPEALATTGPDAAPLALRTLLAERFMLRVHTEVAERPRYTLVFATPAADLRLQFVGTIVRAAGGTAGAADRPANLFTLVNAPLALTLERHRDRVEVLVVDNAALPTGH